MKLKTTSIFLLFFHFSLMAQKSDTLFYVGDPLCSWCYGFAPELNEVKENLPKGMHMEIILGGLRPYNTETMKELSDFLHEHWTEVGKRSGQSFNFEILKDYSFVYDTEPPSRAIRVVRELAPEKEWSFFKAVQKLFYQDNKNTNELDTYLPLLAAMDIDQKAFSELFSSDKMKTATRWEFEKAARMGVRGFPTLVLKSDDQYYLVSNGYASAQQILESITAVKN